MITEDHLHLLLNIYEQCQEKVMSGQSHNLAATSYWMKLQTSPEKKVPLQAEFISKKNVCIPLWNLISGITDVSKTLSHYSKLQANHDLCYLQNSYPMLAIIYR